MRLIYNIAIRGYYLLVFSASFFNKKASQWINGRKNIFNQLEKHFHAKSETAWFHCASLGEFEQTRPLIEAFKTENSEYKIIVTFFSPSGYQIRKNYEQANLVCYLPIDTLSNASKFLEIVKPTIAFMCKYDIWPNYMNQLSKRQVPTYLISSNFRESQIYFKWYGVFFLKSLKQFSHIFTQNEKTVELLSEFNIETTKTGDTRFDKVFETAQKSEKLELVEQFKNNEKILILGSSWQKDEEVLIDIINKNCSENWKCIIAPHEVDINNINRIEKLLKLKSIRYSEANNFDLKNARILIIDSIGILSKTYKYCNIAYIGGGFGTKGLHNILEPATFGLPVIFGPNHSRFPEAQDLINAGGGICISNSNDFENVFDKLNSNKRYFTDTGNACKNFVLQNIGSTQTIMMYLNKHFKS